MGERGGVLHVIVWTGTSQTCDEQWDAALHGTLWQQSHTLELENLLLERESKLVALQLEDAPEGGVAAEEDGHLKKEE